MSRTTQQVTDGITKAARHLQRVYGPMASAVAQSWAEKVGDRRWLAVAQYLNQQEA